MFSWPVLPLLIFLLSGFRPWGAFAQAPFTSWERADLPVASSLRALSVPEPGVIWVGGSGGALYKSEDGGQHWEDIAPYGSDSLDFRDIEVFANGRAIAMSAGAGSDSRLYHTRDGGRHWEEVWRNTEPAGFFNGLAFWNARAGILTGDPVDGYPFLLKTTDGGMTWRRLGPAGLPPIDSLEYGFAASGTHIAVADPATVWLGTGGARARVFRSLDGGAHWEAFPTPLAQGKASTGLFSLAFRDPLHGLAVGGDYQDPGRKTGTAARSLDGGETWQPMAGPGYQSCVLALPDGWLAAGTIGSHFLMEGGSRWQTIDREAWNVLAAGPLGQVWGAGANGMVGQLRPAP